MKRYIFKGEDERLDSIVNKAIGLWVDTFDESAISVYTSLDDYLYKVQQVIADLLSRRLKEWQQNDGDIIFSQLQITDKIESKTDEPHKTILVNAKMVKETYNGVNFDDYIFLNISAKNTKFKDCRFRNATFLFCDLRYAEFDGGTFERATIAWCDLYRAYFHGLIRFAKASISSSSLNNAYFASSVLLRKKNFKDHSILQQNADEYRIFLTLCECHRKGNDRIRNDEGKRGEAKIEYAVHNRYAEVELIYKSLSSTFSSNGFSNDSNWAYVQGKIAERKELYNQLCSCKNWKEKLTLSSKWLINFISHWLFGYGEGLHNICLTYLVLVQTFTIVYLYNCDITNFFQAFTVSLKNMIGVSSEVITEKENIWLSLLNLIQTTVGILLTGIFGFVLGNKIRD